MLNYYAGGECVAVIVTVDCGDVGGGQGGAVGGSSGCIMSVFVLVVVLEGLVVVALLF